MEEIIKNGQVFIPFRQNKLESEEMVYQSSNHFQWSDQRRSVRDFSEEEVPREVIENLIKTASTAPSGAHKQPWTFCAVSNASLKKKIRMAAEEEEKENYSSRMSETWKQDLQAFDTNWQKPFLEIAPWLIIVFKKIYDLDKNKEKIQHYYVSESVGLACGFLLHAIHKAGLVALTHTPSPMSFLSKLLNRPPYEKPFLLIPVGYPAKDAVVPKLERKTLDEIAVFYD
jgi:iodotyrosine deiodinase